MTRKSWRDALAIHPVADAFPLMKPEELRELADDIKKNGLREPITTWTGKEIYVVDGRNRLDAMELAGIQTIDRDGCIACSYGPIRDGEDPATYVISANIRRRHLTKKQQVSLIVKAVKAGSEFANRGKSDSIDHASTARSIGGSPKGQKGGGGSTKDPVKEQVVEEAAKLGISERTATQVLIDEEPERKQAKPRRTFVTCPECSARVADLDKHLKVKHKAKAGRREQSVGEAIAQDTVRQLEKALMNAQEVAGRCNVYEVAADKAALKKILRLYDQLEECITLGRERIKNRPSDKEIKRVLTGGTSIKKLGP